MNSVCQKLAVKDTARYIAVGQYPDLIIDLSFRQAFNEVQIT